MLLQLDFESKTPIYRQIRDQVVLGIARGALRDGERLPSIRALAAESGVNMMTVSKAYALLREEGYIRADRRGGTTVCAPPGEGPVPEKTLRALRLAGLDETAALALCRSLLREGIAQAGDAHRAQAPQEEKR